MANPRTARVTCITINRDCAINSLYRNELIAFKYAKYTRERLCGQFKQISAEYCRKSKSQVPNSENCTLTNL